MRRQAVAWESDDRLLVGKSLCGVFRGRLFCDWRSGEGRRGSRTFVTWAAVHELET